MNAVNSPPLDANQMARTAIVIVLTSATGSILWVGSDSNMWLIERWIKLLFSSKNPETCAACLLVCLSVKITWRINRHDRFHAYELWFSDFPC